MEYCMGKNVNITSNMHYLSQCIIRNFKSYGSPLYECSVKEGGEPQPRAVSNLFSGTLIWSQETEKMLSGVDYESKLAPVLRELCSLSMDNCSTSYSFAIYDITEQDNVSVLQKLVLQSQLVMRAENSPKNTESSLNSFKTINISGLSFFLLEVLPKARSSPLILVDSNSLWICRNKTNELKKLEMSFCFPISETRLILICNGESMLTYFTEMFQDVNNLNLERILSNNRDCRVASTNSSYLATLLNQIENYTSILPKQATIQRNSSAIPKNAKKGEPPT